MTSFADSRLPRALIWLALGASVIRIQSVWAHLPARMASHFDAAGTPNGFASREQFFGIMLAVACLPLLLTMLPVLLRALPNALINLPNRDYWLAPARRPVALERLGTWSAWLALPTELVLLLSGELTIRANLRNAPLDSGVLWLGLGLYCAVLIAWLVALYRAFRLPPSAPALG